jgi:endothelin-converting enzyme/putative endopeptidase
MIRLALLALIPLASSSAALAAGTSTLPASGFDASSVDKSVDACSDFYQHVCGGWMKKNPIPPDQSRWGRFDVLRDENLAVLRGILEDAAKAKKRDPDTQRIGDFYSSCMDDKGVAKKGLKPLEPTLTRIAALKDKKQLPALLASLHDQGAGGFFEFGPVPDFKNATVNIAGADQGGLGLPDQAYYTREDPKAAETREKYVQHVRRTFELAGEKPEAAAAKAQAVMSLETKLAKGSLDVVSRRDPSKQYHKMPVSELQALSPGFDWKAYFDAADGAPKFTDLNVAWPDFIKSMNAALTETSLDDLKSYLTWHALHAASPFLPDAFVNERFDFYGKTLTGAKELKPRWKRCVEATDGAIGEALGRIYVEKTFGAEGKARVVAMVQGIEKALEHDIKQLDWMGEQTKMAALSKLAAIENKIGYPDKWRDYSTLVVKPGDALGNVERANAFETRRQLKKIDQPVDRTEWQMTPPTVNAYYDPLENNINFPAGILQPPFFSRTADDGINYGGVGAVIGHELTHGFDDQGRQFDAQGNLRDWWTADDNKRFDERAQCFVDEYGSFVAVDDVKLNGKLTLGENCADNGGLRIALMALDEANAEKKPAPVDGYTPDQRLFLGWAQVWCQNVTPEASRMRAQTDPHSPGRYRVNGVVRNMPEFQRAFGCKPAAPAVKQCRVW